MYLSTTNKVQKDGHIDLHEQLQNINPGQFSSVHIFQKWSIIIQTGAIIKQSLPKDPWNGPLARVINPLILPGVVSAAESVGSGVVSAAETVQSGQFTQFKEGQFTKFKEGQFTKL